MLFVQRLALYAVKTANTIPLTLSTGLDTDCCRCSIRGWV